MKVLLGGVRGSWPLAGPDTAIYGGNTTSMLVECDSGRRLLFDLGTGVGALSARLERDGVQELDVFLSHFHLDHIMGLPALGLLYRKQARVNIHGPVFHGRHPRQLLSRLFDPPLWSMSVDELPARVTFTDMDLDAARTFVAEGIRVSWLPLAHPEGCLAYRVDEGPGGASFVLATDVEWSCADEPSARAFQHFARDCDLLLFDGHFTPEELEHRHGWGHSSWSEALEVARGVGARRLRLIHHAQNHFDVELAAIDQAIQGASPIARLGRDGEVIALP